MTLIKNKFIFPLLILIFFGLIFSVNYEIWSIYPQFKEETSRFRDQNFYQPDHTSDFDYSLAFITTSNEQEYEELLTGIKNVALNNNTAVKIYKPQLSGQISSGDYLQIASLSDYDGIILDSRDSDLTPTINNIAADTPVVTIQSDYPDSNRLSYVGINNHRAGFQIGRILSENINKNQKLVVFSRDQLTTDISSSAEQLKIFGLQEAIAASGLIENLEIMDTEVSLLDVSQKLTEILTDKSKNEITAIFTSDEELTELTLQLLPNIRQENRPDFIGYTSDQNLKAQIDQGPITMLLYKNLNEIGKKAAKEMLSYLNDGSVNLFSRIEIELLMSRSFKERGAESSEINELY